MTKKRIMVAGIGNAFFKDDGFGPAVVGRLLNLPRRDGVVIRDFGTGGLKLAYDLMQGFDALIIIDAVKRGEAPGTLYVIEPNPNEIAAAASEGESFDPHGADVYTVLRTIKAFNAWPLTTLIIGCEPANVADADMVLSEEVWDAVDRAVALVQSKIEELARA